MFSNLSKKITEDLEFISDMNKKYGLLNTVTALNCTLVTITLYLLALCAVSGAVLYGALTFLTWLWNINSVLGGFAAWVVCSIAWWLIWMPGDKLRKE